MANTKLHSCHQNKEGTSSKGHSSADNCIKGFPLILKRFSLPDRSSGQEVSGNITSEKQRETTC